eukprot:7261833-Ditylum_brightwellii.AAC.1
MDLMHLMIVISFFVKLMQRQDSSREAANKKSAGGPNKRTSQGTDLEIKHNSNNLKSGQPDTQLKR